VGGFEECACCVVSDHPHARLLEQKTRLISEQVERKLPAILRLAVRGGVRVRSVETFKRSLVELRHRIRSSASSYSSSSSSSLKNKMRTPTAPNIRGPAMEQSSRQLPSPFIKLQDGRGLYAPNLKEHPQLQPQQMFLHHLAGKSVFHAPTSMNGRCSSTRRRSRPPMAQNPNRSGFCEICVCPCDNLHQHFLSRDHQIRTNVAGFFDEVDTLLGSYNDKVTGQVLIRRDVDQRQLFSC